MGYEDGGSRQLMAEYLWRMEESERQVDLDFPLARTTNNHWSLAFLNVMAELSRDARLCYLHALAKRDYREAAEEAGADLTPDEAAMIRDVDRRIQAIRQPLWLAATSRRGRDPNRIKKAAAASALLAALEPVLGLKPKRLSPDDIWVVNTPVDGWYLTTLLMLGHRHPFSVRIMHKLVQRADDPAALRGASQFLGFVHPSWEIGNETDLAPVLEALIGLSRFALDVVPTITRQITDHAIDDYGNLDVAAYVADHLAKQAPASE